MEKARILIIEDDPDWRGILVDTLEKEYDVQTATTAKEGMAALKLFGLQLILMDLNLVDEEGANREGLRLLSFIGMTNPCARAIVLTAHSGHQRESFRASYGVFDYLLKQEFEEATFLQAVSAAVQEALECEKGKEKRPAYPEYL
jgi:DNA-binding NtrC family response regulator